VIVKLRTLAMKSKLGFGYQKDWTVEEHFILYKEYNLLTLYYGFGNIDFNDEIKAKLFITREREIPKPGSLRHDMLHPTLGITQHEIISLCISDFNKANSSDKGKLQRGNYNRMMNKQDKDYKKHQWGEKGYRKGVMSYINQHGGINR
jgi:hypothetical protein